MKPLQFELSIAANPAMVWKNLFEQAAYQQWTSVFKEGSFYQGDWSLGSEMLFLAPDDLGQLNGMQSRITENTPFRSLTIEHYGVINNGEPSIANQDFPNLVPAYETYKITETEEGCDLRIEMKIDQVYHAHLEESWPTALLLLRQLCESQAPEHTK